MEVEAQNGDTIYPGVTWSLEFSVLASFINQVMVKRCPGEEGLENNPAGDARHVSFIINLYLFMS
jgi:hypothetical protein